MTCPPERRLAITRHTPLFAPGAQNEKLLLDYEVENMDDAALVIEISDKGQQVVYREELRQPISGRLDWQGRALDGTYITPLGSPFTVRLFNTNEPGEHDQVTFRVEYHSVRIVRGRWAPEDGWNTNTPAPQGADEPRWVRFMLNELGYFGGPLGGNFHGYDVNAATRYRASHPTLTFDNNELRWTHTDFPTSGANLTNEPDRQTFLTALANGDAPRDCFTRPLGQGRQRLAAGDPLGLGNNDVLRIHVEALPWMANAHLNELGEQYPPNPTHSQIEQARLNRPLIPLEAEVYLRGSDGSAMLSPEAVGAVRIDWRFTEPQEDLRRQFQDDEQVASFPRSYIEQCLQMNGGRTNPLSGNNCHVDHGGIRTTDGSNYRTPFVLGTHYGPYDAQDDGQVVHTSAHTGNVASCRGRAGILFQPSFIAGDRYRLQASIRMTGLDAQRPPEKSETNLIEVWRDAKVAAVLGWPVRQDLTQQVWEQVRNEYAKAYVDLDISAVSGQPMTPISQFLQNGDYTTWFNQWLHAYSADVSSQLSAHAMLTLQPTGDEDNAARAGFLATSEQSMDDLWKTLCTRVRAQHPTGAILVAFRVANQDLGGFESDVSMSMPNFGVFLNRLTEGKTYYITAHELAHCLFLNHGPYTASADDVKKDHDLGDHNCIMDYARATPPPQWPHKSIQNYSPHFCGRCNLKLRGWDLLSIQNPLPAHSSRITVCEWRKTHVPLGVGTYREIPAVQLRVDTCGVPNGTAATITIRDAATNAQVQQLTGLTVWSGIVWATQGKQLPEFVDQTPQAPNTPWQQRRYTFEVRIDLDHCALQANALQATTATPLEIYCHESVVFFDQADEEALKAGPEVESVVSALHGVPGHGVHIAAFNRNPHLEKWIQKIEGCHIYHHISHGGVQCEKDGQRADVTELLPKYPAWCQGDRRTLESIQNEAFTLFSDGKDCRPVFQRYITPDNKKHPLRGAIQWVIDRHDSKKDVVFTAEQIRKKLKHGPRHLAFLSCCVLGWETSLAKVFLEKGTPYVIAFRCAYNSGEASAFASLFYSAWSRDNLDPQYLRANFIEAGLAHPHAEPVLFAKDFITRVFLEAEANMEMLDWSQEALLSRPRIPQKYRGAQ